MNSRLASISDVTAGRSAATESPKPENDGPYCNIKSRLRSRLPGGYSVSDLIKVRIYPSLQGVVVGKVWGREALRVITAPYRSSTTPVPATAIDLPAQLIPDQSGAPCFQFENPQAVAACVRHFSEKAAIKREQELTIIDWVNKKENQDYSTYSAFSDNLYAETGEVATHEVESDSSDDAVTMSGSSSGAREKVVEQLVAARKASEPAKEVVQMEDFQKEISQQMGELREMLATVIKRQKDCEEQIKQVASKVTSAATSQWEQLEEKVQAMTAVDGGLEGGRRGTHKRDHGVDDDDPDWPDKDGQQEDIDWQVRAVKRAGDAQEEKLECPFKPQPRRLDGFRVPRAHRRAHRRFLEDVYGGHDSAMAAARAILEQMEKETRAPSWEVACFLNAARGLDILLLEHQEGMWSQWNQPMVDFLARFYFEMLARIRPDEDVVQLMNPELQRKIREFNFGKQRAYGPLTAPTRPAAQKPWRNFQSYTSTGNNASGSKRDQGNVSKRAVNGGEEQQEGVGMEGHAMPGNWVWQPPPPTGGRPPPQPFRNEIASSFSGIAGPRPPL